VAAAREADAAAYARAAEGEPAYEPAEGPDEVAPPTDDSPQPAEATVDGESSEAPAEGAAEKAE
jgi:hypothetical protein